jgi:triacylglycerol lipase
VMEPVARMRLPGMFTMECVKGECCSRFRTDLAAPFPESVAFTSVYSKRDGVVDWHACLDPAAKPVEVRAGHVAMGYDPTTLRAVRRSLA